MELSYLENLIIENNHAYFLNYGIWQVYISNNYSLEAV